MKGRRNPFVAREGIPFLLVAAILTVGAWHYGGLGYSILPTAALAWLFLIFRDPKRDIPATPLGVVSPVDGVVIDVGLTDKSVLNGEAQKIIIRVNSLGTYTARCPVEGKIMDFHGDPQRDQAGIASSGLWVQTDEGDDVVLQFHGHRLGLAPLAFLRYGERVGQGQRCAYLRLTRFAEVQVPINVRIQVAAGQRVLAGRGLLAKLPHH